MKILNVVCSPRGQASESGRLSQKIIGFLLKREPEATVINRLMGAGAIPGVDESEAWLQEVESSDCLVIGTPMHNLTVPVALKAWIDQVVRIGRTFKLTPQGKVGALQDRPVFVAVASGGRYSGENAQQPDFLTPYLKVILGSIGLHDVTFFSVEGTGIGPDAVADARADADQALREHFFGYNNNGPDAGRA
jgi:FMN-dependent NADH-azoreductase